MKKKTLLSLSLLSVAALVACGPKTSEPSGSTTIPTDGTSAGTEVPPSVELPKPGERRGEDLEFAASTELKDAYDAIPAIPTGQNYVDLNAEQVKSLVDVITTTDGLPNSRVQSDISQKYNEVTEENPYTFSQGTTSYVRHADNILSSESNTRTQTAWRDAEGAIQRGDVTENTQSVLVGRNDAEGKGNIYQLSKAKDAPANEGWATTASYDDDTYRSNLTLGVGSEFLYYVEVVQDWATYLSGEYTEEGVVVADDGIQGVKGILSGTENEAVILSYSFTKALTDGPMVADLEFDYFTQIVIVEGVISQVSLALDILIIFEGETETDIYETDRLTATVSNAEAAAFGNDAFDAGAEWDISQFLIL